MLAGLYSEQTLNLPSGFHVIVFRKEANLTLKGKVTGQVVTKAATKAENAVVILADDGTKPGINRKCLNLKNRDLPADLEFLIVGLRTRVVKRGGQKEKYR